MVLRRDIYPPRSECLDHIVVFGERHLRHVLLSYMDYYNGTRTHLSLNKNAPIITCRRGSGAHSVLSDPGWTASPICSGLICGRHSRQPLCNGWEETLHFFPQVRDRLAIAREMPQQASLEKSIKQRIEGAPGDDRLSAAK